jgi:polyhydroxyalkanoate synthesis repressor PhaR
MRIIKRYRNRKLYDSEAHRYITVHDLAKLVRKGDEFKVQDHVTGADYTAQTLALILVEEAKTSPRNVDVSVFEKVIREGIPEKTAEA